MVRRKPTQPAAVVMNVFYTGLGIARSLGSRGIRVIGLSAHRGVYGNFTRYAEIRRTPDSREQPEQLFAFLMQLATELPEGSVIFPTRDDDVVFLNRFRTELSNHFRLVLPPERALEISLDKWETYEACVALGVPAPRTFSVGSEDDVVQAAQLLQFPCVLKPLSAHHWRKPRNWKAVGGRKAIGIDSSDDLMAEYRNVSRADRRAIIQEAVPGRDDCLYIAACFVGPDHECVAGFTAQKLLQVPEGFGTGCIVQSIDRPDLLRRATDLLRHIGFTGIAEVEFKLDARNGEYKVIEINPRPWDQHVLGKACGVDVMLAAYCSLTALPFKPVKSTSATIRWIADDVFLSVAIRSLVRRGPKITDLLGLVSGKRVFAIWAADDPLPFVLFSLRFIPQLAITAARGVHRAILHLFAGRRLAERGEVV